MPDIVNVIAHKVKDFSNARYQDLLQEASPSVLRKIGKYYFLRDRVLKIAGYHLLRYAIEQTGGSPEFLEQVHFGDHGKPFIRGWNSYSISYSCDRVVLAYGAVDGLGIDLEYKKDMDIASMRSVCHPAELGLIDCNASPNDAFYAIWVKKEAVLKACGTGLTDALEKIDCSGSQIFYSGRLWHFTQIKFLEEEYACYVSTACKEPRLNILDLGLDRIL